MNAEIKSVEEILQYNLNIPDYQRPYKWQTKNIIALLEDINAAIIDATEFENYKYRIGTLILHSNKGEFDIIDGQQRIISLILLKLFLKQDFECNLLNKDWNNIVTKQNIKQNYKCIKNWFSNDSKLMASFDKAFSTILEFVVLSVNNLPDAFQLFDSQNTRGKELDPHDLLKAYHLREMKNDPYEMFHAVEKWESFLPSNIKNLFGNFLFPILNWSRKDKTSYFTVNKIDYYKGISKNSNYTYSRKAQKSEPYFQITEPFISGNDFFEMTAHYLSLLNDVTDKLNKDNAFRLLKKFYYDKDDKNSLGYNYSYGLFTCALLCYYDRFHNFDKKSIYKIFAWAYMIRINMQHLGYDTINKYAIGEENYKYSNNIPMFALICQSRFHTDISNLIINTKLKDDKQNNNGKWDDLYKTIKFISGGENE